MTKTQNGKATSKKSQNGTSAVAGTRASSTTKSQKTLDDLLKDALKDMLSAEQQLVEALPEMAKACDSEELQEAFQKHLQQTIRQAERIEKVMQRLGMDPSEEETCEAMQGLIAEGNEIIENYEPGPVRDSALIIAAQKVEHYEIASYGSICELCDVLGYTKMSDLLGRSLEEEENTDEELTELAQDINDEAHEMSYASETTMQS